MNPSARRCYVVEYLGYNRAVFCCQEGHRWQDRVIRRQVPGIPMKVWDRQNEAGARRMASWWSREKGGVTMACPLCKAAS